MSRPRLLIGVLGTHTEVGKTWVSAQLLAQARSRGLRVAARKPVQSYEEGSSATDAEQLAAATGEAITDICLLRRCYPLALAPPMAADLLRRPRIALAELADEIIWPAELDWGLVETVGGLLSPIAHDGDSLDLVKRLQPDRIVLVADAGLGTLNAVRLSLGALRPLEAIVVLNRFDATNELHRLNRAWLEGRYAAHVVTDVEALFRELASAAQQA